MAMQETWSYSTWFGKCSIQYAYTMFWLYDILRFDSTIFIKCTYQHIMSEVKQPNSSKVWSILHEYYFWVYLNT